MSEHTQTINIYCADVRRYTHLTTPRYVVHRAVSGDTRSLA